MSGYNTQGMHRVWYEGNLILRFPHPPRPWLEDRREDPALLRVMENETNKFEDTHHIRLPWAIVLTLYEARNDRRRRRQGQVNIEPETGRYITVPGKGLSPL